MSFYGLADDVAPGRAGQRRREALDADAIPSGGGRPATNGTPPSAPCSPTGSPSVSGWSVRDPALEPWIGRTLAELVAERGRPSLRRARRLDARKRPRARRRRRRRDQRRRGRRRRDAAAPGSDHLEQRRRRPSADDVRDRRHHPVAHPPRARARRLHPGGRGLAAHRPPGDDLRHARPGRAPGSAPPPTSPCSRSTSSTGTRRSSWPTSRAAALASGARRVATATPSPAGRSPRSTTHSPVRAPVDWSNEPEPRKGAWHRGCHVAHSSLLRATSIEPTHAETASHLCRRRGLRPTEWRRVVAAGARRPRAHGLLTELDDTSANSLSLARQRVAQALIWRHAGECVDIRWTCVDRRGPGPDGVGVRVSPLAQRWGRRDNRVRRPCGTASPQASLAPSSTRSGHAFGRLHADDGAAPAERVLGGEDVEQCIGGR